MVLTGLVTTSQNEIIGTIAGNLRNRPGVYYTLWKGKTVHIITDQKELYAYAAGGYCATEVLRSFVYSNGKIREVK